MTRRNIRRTCLVLSVALALGSAACDLTLANPNAPPEQTVLNTPDGLVALAVGMQAQYAGGVGDFLIPPSLMTDEWGTTTRSLIAYQSLLTGQNFDTGYAVVLAPWADAYRTVKSANDLLAHAPLVLDAGLEAGTVALAKLFKAMALGTIILQYQSVPIDITVPGPVPQARSVVLDTVLALLQSARADFTSVTAANLAGFDSRVRGTNFDVLNTIDAMRARYSLVAGQYAQAIAAADSVKPNVLSVLTYTAPAVNPIWDLAVSTGYIRVLKSFKDQAVPGDGRVAYWADTTAAPTTGNPDSLLLPLKKYGAQTDPYPVYLPDEMKLVKAEAFTRLGQLDSAAFYVNAVRTQTSSALDEPVASLPPLDPLTQLDTPAKLLAQIAYERRYELFEQGLRWEDTRRLGDALTTTPTFPFLPVPQVECGANPSQPCAP
jgi:starch-binding outer membrane protein, SusD/RagB family